MPRPTVEERFFAKVRNKDPIDCWEWTATRNHLGYGQFWNGSRNVRAHRWAFEFFRAEIIPYNLPLDHECDNPGCVNPWHLDVVDWGENMKRRVRRGRWRAWSPEKQVRGGPPEPPYRLHPQYRQHADRVADEIDAGRLKPGTRIRVPVVGLGFYGNTRTVMGGRVAELLVSWGYAIDTPSDGLVVAPAPLRPT